MQVKRSYTESAIIRDPSESITSSFHGKDPSYPGDRNKLVNLSCQIGDHIGDQAIWLSDGTIGWITTGALSVKTGKSVRTVPLFLYDGYAGVALFFGALYHITGDGRYLKMARASLDFIIGRIGQFPRHERAMTGHPLGIGSGFGSLVYVFIKSAFLLDDESWIDQARRVSENLSEKLIDKDTVYDVLCGSAGALLAFLALYQVSHDTAYLDKAIYCGDHLVRGKVFFGAGQCGWKTFDGRALSGFSHGAAGIACSLLRLFEHTGDQRFFQTAVEAIQYEDSLYVSKHRNWEDLRQMHTSIQKEAPRFMTSWCHGAPGIALGRLITWHILHDDRIALDIENALETTGSFRLDGVDHLCCGNMGRIEVLLYAGLKLNRPHLVRESGKRAALVMAKMRKEGHLGVFHDPSVNIFHLGFFQGLSGIGYELLRLVHPEVLPSVLAFE